MQLVKEELTPRLRRPVEFSSWRKQLQPYVGTPGNAAITVICIALIAITVQKVIGWLFLDAVFTGTPTACKESDGACWPFFASKLRFMLFGFYPYDEHWRPTASLLLFFAACGISMNPAFWGRKLMVLWGCVLAVCLWLMLGGVFGLSFVPTSQWGGLPLSFMLSFVGLAGAFPLGIALALARASKLPVIRVVAIAFIELVRGVPLISILFMASVMLPLFMPGGMTIDKLLRAQIAIILFAAAYVAEIVRGGLQAIPRGQYEASAAMGLHYWQMMRLIVLPQAIKIMIPPLVTLFIGFFQDTTLVVIVGLLDFLDTVRSAMREPQWQGIAVLEGYLFAAVVYLFFSTIMGAYSRYLERYFRMGHD
ncbi:general L-amino acid transport system permease protein [Microvirga flocculans]|uniref:General L-amino acid transport system permease protein n=1 Tax=Microvirga flocculans TaxID=217168 RepID=A0A7W6N9Y0_9HYPH|nr:amino acid ABC transporter permease [Microvirga flocculans]MBB4042166.1 general L-amino acid transport system permease protein [Microvirga flocculans]